MQKQKIRKRIWNLMEKEGVSLFPGSKGRILNFKGADSAANLLSNLKEWQNAKAIKANPDSPQRAVRHLALNSGKIIFMAVPRLRDKKCFIKLDPSKINPKDISRASSIKGAFKYGIPVHPKEIQQVDLIVAGSVAINRKGSRTGKGGGFSDLEYAIGREFGFVKEDIPIVTTVHPLQIVDGELPECGHDFKIDFIVTPDEVISTKREGGRPKGIIREHLKEEKIEEIPILQEILS